MLLPYTDKVMTRAELAFTLAKEDARVEQIPIVEPFPWNDPYGGPPILSTFPHDIPKGIPPVKQITVKLNVAEFQECPLVYLLIELNKDVWDQFMNHPFPKAMRNGTASLDHFRYYLIQDIQYCESYIRTKMMSVAQDSLQNLAIAAAKLPAVLQYTQGINDICVQQLGIAQNVIDATEMSQQLKKCHDFQADIARNQNWFTFHIALLPCLLGYFEISYGMLGDPKTARNTPYHTMWTIFNADESFAKAYIKFINDNIFRYFTPQNFLFWLEIFRRSCELEIAFFDVGRSLPAPYETIPTGTYYIINFANGNVLDVIPSFSLGIDWVDADMDISAHQGVGQSSAPSSQFSTGEKLKWPTAQQAHNLVYTSPLKNKDSQKWKLTPTNNGYTIENVKTGQYAIARLVGGKTIVYRSRSPGYWWIAPLINERAPTKYQFYPVSSIKYALGTPEETRLWPFVWMNENDFVDPFKTIFRDPGAVIAANNYHGSSQMWTLTSVSE